MGPLLFRRESFVPMGGPDGGDGGRGGSIILRADTHTDNLTPFFYEPIVKAKHGERGEGEAMLWQKCADKIVPVPIGTIVYRLQDEETEEADPQVTHGDGAMFVDFSRRRRAKSGPSGTARRRSMRVNWN